jgi:hypothetical protein
MERGQNIVQPVPAPAKELSQDPDKVLEAPPAALPVVAVAEPVVTPVAAPVEKRFEYQPKDERGHPLGGKQVVIYTDEADLQQKFAAKEEQLVRRLRELTRREKLGITDNELPADTELAVFEQPKPRTLTAEERFQLSQDINDPEKSIDAINTILEASVGYSAEQMRKQFDDANLAKLQHQAFVNYKVFEQQVTEFYPCTENAQILTDWMFSKKLAPTVKNYNLAFSTLRGAGLLQEAPTVREVTPAPSAPVAPAAIAAAPPAAVVPASTEPKPVVPAEVENRIIPQTPPQQERQPVRVPSGLNGRTSADSGTPSVRTSLTFADFDKIPADELKRKLKDPQFAAMVNELFTPKKPV